MDQSFALILFRVNFIPEGSEFFTPICSKKYRVLFCYVPIFPMSTILGNAFWTCPQQKGWLTKNCIFLTSISYYFWIVWFIWREGRRHISNYGKERFMAHTSIRDTYFPSIYNTCQRMTPKIRKHCRQLSQLESNWRVKRAVFRDGEPMSYAIHGVEVLGKECKIVVVGYCGVSNCRVSNCQVSNCRVSNCRVSNCRVSNCRVSNCRVSNCRMSNCRVSNCRWATVVVSKCRVSNCHGTSYYISAINIKDLSNRYRHISHYIPVINIKAYRIPNEIYLIIYL